MMETMSLNPEQFYKPEKKEDKPQLKLNLNLGMEDRWNTVLSSPDLKKIAINTPELDRMVANTQVFGNYNSQLPPPYSAHGREEPVSVQGPSMTQMPGPEEEEVTRSFIAALREIHEQNDFKSETFNLPASSAGPTIPYTDSYKPQIAAPECSQSWNNFQAPVSSYGYNPMQTSHHNYMGSQPGYMQQEQLPQYEDKSLIDTFIPDPNQIDKLNLSTAEKLNIYSQIPIHEVADPELQERLKSERKKMRNRIAASKCRKRKLQKEAELEDKVKILKKKNTDLSSQLLALRDEVKELKVKIMSHVNAGCAIKSYTEQQQQEQTLNSLQTPMQLGAPVVSLPNMHMNSMTL